MVSDERVPEPLQDESQMNLPITEASSQTPGSDSTDGRLKAKASARKVRSSSRSSAERKIVGPVDPPTTYEEIAAGIKASDLADLYALESIKHFGPVKFREIYKAGLTFGDVISNPTALPTPGKRGSEFRTEIAALRGHLEEYQQRAFRQIRAAVRVGAKIVTYWHSAYPRQVFSSNYPVPAIYLIGSTDVLADEHTVACVGSRLIRPPYTDFHRSFAEIAVAMDFAVVSGFALGADTLGHRTAFEMGGKTICVMPGGLDRPFPPENRGFWRELTNYSGAALISEFPFGFSASGLTLRKRNKLIVGFSQGVFMSQSSEKGGAMNAYRFAIELGRPFATFEPDDQSDTGGNRFALDQRKGNVTEFHRGSEEEIRQWLQRLSSST